MKGEWICYLKKQLGTTLLITLPRGGWEGEPRGPRVSRESARHAGSVRGRGRK